MIAPSLARRRLRRAAGALAVGVSLGALAPALAAAGPRIVSAAPIVSAGTSVELSLTGFDPGGIAVTITLDGRNPVPYSVPVGGAGTVEYPIPLDFGYGTFDLEVCAACGPGPEEQSAWGRLSVVSGELFGADVDVQVRGLEVTQGVRRDIPTRSLYGGSFILPPESTVHVANRRTVVRVYPDFDTGLTPPSDVALEVSLTGVSGGDVLGTLTQTRVLSLRRTLRERRSSPAHGVQFELPASWVGLSSSVPAKEIRFIVELTLAGEPSGFELNNDAELYGVDFEHVEGVPFTPDGAAFRLRPHFLTRIFETSPGDSTTLFANPLVMLPTMLENYHEIMPIADGRHGVRFWSMRFGTFRGETDIDGQNLFTDWAVRRYLPGATMWGHPDNFFYGMLFAQAICAGKGWVGSAYFQSYVCPSPDYTVSHELTHAVGSRHAGNGHGELAGGGFDPSYPGDHGQVEADAFGYNVYRGIAYPPTTTVAPEYLRHDYMSYGPSAWVSAYTWNKVTANLESGSVGVSRLGAPPVVRGGGNWRMFTGFLNPDTFETEIGALFETTPPTSFDPQENGYRVIFHDAFGDVLGDSPIVVEPVQDDLEENDWIHVACPIQVPEAWVTMTIEGPDGTWDVLPRSNAAPTVTLNNPEAGFSWPQSGSATVSWSGSDEDGDDLVYRVVGIRNGTEVHVLESDVETEVVALDLDELPGGGNWELWVEASDGFDSGFSQTTSGTAEKKAPLAVIALPRDGAIFPEGHPIRAHGVFIDPEDPDAQPGEQSLEWTLGSEESFFGDVVELGALPVGTHQLTVKYVSPSRLVGEHTIEFEVVGELPTPTPFSPADGAEGVATPTLLEWNEVPGDLTYRVEVALDPSFDELVAVGAPLFDESFALASEPGQTYYWRVASEGSHATSPWSPVQSFTTDVAVAVGGTHVVSAGLRLRAQPNPFNPTTRIVFEMPAHGDVEVRIHDAAGARVRTLYDGPLTGGAHALPWDGTDGRGLPVASGVYFVRVSGADEVATTRLVLMK